MGDKTLKFVRKSTYLQKALKALDSNVLIPTKISKRSDIKTNHVSKMLNELKSKGYLK